MGPIVLVTDFGHADAYVGVMKGVILRINPRATVIDLCHGIAPQAIEEGARILAENCAYFPESSIFVAVVDPGVGGERRAIALSTPSGTFIGPDNGILSLVARDFGDVPVEAGRWTLNGTRVSGVVLENPAFFLPRVSATFHGRDIFAPVAAHRSRGVPLSSLGAPLSDLVFLPASSATWQDGAVVGQVRRVDRFGNAITNIGRTDLAPLNQPVVVVAGQRLKGVRHHYAEESGLLALLGSADRLEIAINGGNAAATLGIKVGDPVVVREGASDCQ